MFKLTLQIAIIIALSSLGFLILTNLTSKPSFAELSPSQMHDTLIEQRDYAINQARLAGDYRCCIEPACTMCYMEGNQWNNNTPGTCACDDLIAEGKEPCPQCGRGIAAIHNDEGTFCDINASVATCNSQE